MNDMTFQTGGEWSSTTLYNSGAEVLAAQLFVEVRAGRDEWDNPIRGGIYDGTDLTAVVRPQQNPEAAWDILPGKLTLTFPGHTLVLENFHPLAEPQATRVWYNNQDITDRVVDVYVDVNALDDVVKAFVTVYKPRWLAGDEVITYTIVA
jgi:hypothetical protein